MLQRNHGFTRNRLIAGVGRPRVPNQNLENDSNLTATSRSGITINAGAANDKGVWEEVIAATANDAFGIWLNVQNIGSNTAINNFLLDIGIGAVGLETVVVPNLGCGAAGGGNAWGKYFYIPGLFIPAGSRISARSQSNTASKTGTLMIVMDEQSKWDISESTAISYGVDLANSRGEGMLAGASGVWSVWRQIGSGTLRDHRAWTLQMDQNADSTLLDESTYLAQLGYGPGTSSIRIIGAFHYFTGLQEIIGGPFPLFALAPVESGALLWVRFTGTEAESRGFIATAV